MDDMYWDELSENFYVCRCRFPFRDYFEEEEVPGDGNCFFYAISYLLFGNLKEWRAVKSTVERWSSANWTECREARHSYNSSAEYRAALMQSGYWGGSVEADILSRALNTTIILWTVDISGRVEIAYKYGKSNVSTSLNLKLYKGHFNALVPVQHIEGPAKIRELPDLLSAASVVVDSSTSLEEMLLSGDEVEVNEEMKCKKAVEKREALLHKSSANKLMANIKKPLEEGVNIPMKVGRVLFKMFNCEVRAQFDKGVIYLVQATLENSKTAMPLSKLAHIVLGSDKKIVEEFANSTVVVTSDLYNHLNIPELLRISLPGTNASQFYDLMHPEFILDLTTCATCVLLSTFLYKTELKEKKAFITSTLRKAYMKPTEIAKTLHGMTNKRLYETPARCISKICLSYFGDYAEQTVTILRDMPPTGLLVLRNLDLTTVSQPDYNVMLDDLRVVSVDLDFFRLDELQEIKRLVDCIIDVREHGSEVTPDSLQQFVYYYLDKGKEEIFVTAKGKQLKSVKTQRIEQMLIKKFFQKKLMIKFVSLQGKAYSGATVSNVLAYCNNLYLTKEELGFDHNDLEQLRCEMVRLRGLLSSEQKEPVALICDKLEERFLELFKELPISCRDECQSLFEDVRNADTHSSAWKSALRLKGLAYEGLMANQYNMTYIPEDLKPNLSMIIQTLYPSKFLNFLERTHLHPEYRDFTPDFVMTQTLSIRKDTLTPNIDTEQLTLSSTGDEDSAPVIPVSKKSFPLPLQSFKEVPNIDSFKDHIVEKQKTNGRETGMLIGETGISFTSEEKLTTPELLILEVGYQTDIEGKVSSDMKKWSDTLNLLKHLGIKATVIACADSSETPSDNWWIAEKYVKLLKSSISYLFNQLQANSPSDVTDIVVGSISTQKIRSMLKSGSVVKTPVTVKEVKECWSEHMKKILIRPTETVLPDSVKDIIEISLVEGVVVEKNSAKEVLDHLVDNSNLILQEFEKTRYAHEVNKLRLTSEKMLLSWLIEDLSCARCKACFVKIKTDIEDYTDLQAAIEYICMELISDNHPPCCHQNPVEQDKVSYYMKRTQSFKYVKHKGLGSDEGDGNLSALDQLVRLTLPGKTERERKIKRGVEQLIRLIMECSKIKAIKLPSGQLVGSKKLLQHKGQFEVELKEHKAKTKESSNEALEERLKKLGKLLSKDRLRGYSEWCIKVINSALQAPYTQQGSKCILNPIWVANILHDLKTDTEDVAIVEKMKATMKSREGLTRNNDKVVIAPWNEIKEYLDVKAKDVLDVCDGPFETNCVLFDEVVLECVIRTFDTPYWDCIQTIVNLLKLLLRFTWYQKLIYYGKICETFLQCCTEFTRSGIKVMRIRHTDMNIAIKVPSNKKENMKCCIYDSNFYPVSNIFLMNRRVAVLGASMYYIILVIFIQCLQHSRCVKMLDSPKNVRAHDIAERTASYMDSMIEVLQKTHSGNLSDARNVLNALCEKNGSFVNRSTKDHFISTVAGLSLTYSVLLGDSLLLNSQPFNKQIQMMRFGMLNGLSMLSSPSELGKKFSSSCRRLELTVARLYLQIIVYCCCYDPESNSLHWKQDDHCPKVSMPSLSIFGHTLNSDRQLVFDIYNVHIYNKELDNFDEGTIKVLEETAERHMTWEIDLLDACKKVKVSKRGNRLLRLLMGIPNVKRSATLEKATTQDETLSEVSSASSQTVLSSGSTGSKLKSYFGRVSMHKKPFSLDENFIVERFEHQDYSQAVSDKWSFNVYRPNKSSILKDVIEVIRRNPSHTMGCFELIQCFTELARMKFPNESIEKTRRHPNNYITVSEVTETTSIVATPRTHVMLKDCFKILMGQENKKFVKMLRGKLQRLGLSILNEKAKADNFTCLLETVDTLTKKQKEEIVKGITKPSKLAFYNWKDLVNQKVESVLITEDGNYIYCWLKSLGSMIKRALKPYMKTLRYDTGVASSKMMLLPHKDIDTDVLEDTQKLIEKLKAIVRGESMELELVNKENPIKLWVQFILKARLSCSIIESGSLSVIQCGPKVKQLIEKYRELQKLKEEYPTLCFSKEEIEIRTMEQTLLHEHNKDIMNVTNCLLYICLCCPWCLHYKSLEVLMSKSLDDNYILDIDDEEVKSLLETSASKVWINSVKETIAKNSSQVLNQAFNEVEIDTDFEEIVSCLTRYVSAIFTSNSQPISCALNQGQSGTEARDQSQIVERLKTILARVSIDSQGVDFIWTCHLISNSNFEVSKKLTGRSTGERLPRSVRSKVIYEIVKLVGDTGMAVLQQLAFTSILDKNHEFFAVLAPKSQLGGHRDLLVQETHTKLIHATTEMFSRTLLSTTKDDGLTNPHLKEQILNSALNKIQMMKRHHGKPYQDGSHLLQFYRVFCISGDNTKWGPIHCCSLFSGMMQQLLKDFQDWSNFYKLTFLKNLFRRVEIPSASIKKILNAVRYNHKGSKPIDMMTELELRELLIDNLKIWEGQPIIQFLVATYISKGYSSICSYNHMGQGIHHATSSILTSIMSEAVEIFITSYLSKAFPKLTTTVEHAGSSDDYAKVLSMSGVLDKDTYDSYNQLFWPTMCKVKNLIAAISRACQMKDSAKTLCGDTFAEFYSEFMLTHRITPAVIKFILTGLINSSVTSPQSMSQACHVSSQQALYNSVPLLTNIAFTLFRQQMFSNHTEHFARCYGPIVNGTVSGFGRLFVPLYSNLISSSIALEDSETISRSLLDLIKEDSKFPTVMRKFLLPGEEEVEEQDAVEIGGSTSSCDPSLTSGSSLSSGSSFSFTADRGLTSTEQEYLKTVKKTANPIRCINIKEYFEEMCGSVSEMKVVKKLKKSNLVHSCEYLRECFDNPVLMIQRTRNILNAVISSYYRTFSSEGTEKTVKANLNRDENTIIEDPMIQLIPEKLRRELERLGLSKMTIDEMLPSHYLDEQFHSVVAKRLIMMNCATENFESEVSRLKQTLTARNVIHGLAGGIKELSVPIYTIFLKSYFFKDNVFYKLHDRWNTKHSSNYRDSSGKRLDGKIVTKYTVWIDTFLSCGVTMDIRTDNVPNSLFDPQLRALEIIHHDNNTVEISLKPSHIETMQKEFESLSLQFSDTNRHKLKVMESQRQKEELDASKVVIVKSSLFMSSDSVKINNSPAVVIGYMLSESALTEVKPTKVDMSNLVRDKFKIVMFYPTLMELVEKIKKESDSVATSGLLPEMNDVEKYANNLTMLCRMVQQSRPKLTSLYIIKSSSLTNEPTVAELISYGVKEGSYYILNDIGIETSTYSVRYWKVLQCVSAIANLPISDSEKTSLLTSFLNWKPSIQMLEKDCGMYKYDAAVLEEFNDRVLLNVLSSELPSIRNERERENIKDLVDFVSSPSQLVTRKPYLGVTETFNKWGEGQKNGKFTFSSSSGEASGIFVNGMLFLVVSNESPSLLHQVEKRVLEWLGQLRSDIVSAEQHLFFISLLADLRSIGRRDIDGRILTPMVNKENPRYLSLAPVSIRKNCKVIRVKKNILSVRKEVVKEVKSEPRLLWKSNSLTIVYDEQTDSMTYHEQLANIHKIVTGITAKKEDKLPSVVYSDCRVVLSKLKLQEQVYFSSASLLHCFFCHALKDSVMEACSKSMTLAHYLQGSHMYESKSAQRLKVRFEQHNEKLTEDASYTESQRVCNELSEILNQQRMASDAWPEVQRMLDETGLHHLNVSFVTKANSSQLLWHITQDASVGHDPQRSSLRSVINSLNSLVLPMSFIPFLTEGAVLDEAIKRASAVKHEISSLNLSDEDLSAIVFCTLLFFEDQDKARNVLCFNTNAIVNLCSHKTFQVDEFSEIKFLIENDHVYVKLIVIGANVVDPIIPKVTRILTTQARVLTAYNSIFSNASSIEELPKKVLNYSTLPIQGKLISTVTLSSKQCASITPDRFFKGLVKHNISKRLSTLNTLDFILFLRGKVAKDIQIAESYADDSEGEITVDDIFPTKKVSPVVVQLPHPVHHNTNQVQPDEAEEKGKMEFDW
ncbi:L [Sapphire II virus]|uniref:RNA-directed RNA polymerase L n=1 Tax=Sapphire II virus TaxID=1810945 RepID=A0A191KWC5_9VIRU|nr:L [Sapphire II virus] [Sapphire II virus]AMT75422.1 RNA-dependent RNA polymerase [Sapphire II virus]QLA46845.1 L [Sapphire II virus] [Sapphire II virus]